MNVITHKIQKKKNYWRFVRPQNLCRLIRICLGLSSVLFAGCPNRNSFRPKNQFNNIPRLETRTVYGACNYWCKNNRKLEQIEEKRNETENS